MHDPSDSRAQELVPLDPRLHRKCETALAKIVTALPDMLAMCQPEQAAAIASDLVKAVLNRPRQVDPEDPLPAVLKKLNLIDTLEPTTGDS